MKYVRGQLSVDEELVYVDSSWIVLPNKSIKSVLSLLHSSHAGVNKTYDIVWQLYFWPGMFNDIKQLIENCQACRIHKPYLPKNLRSTAPPSSYMGPPMAHVGTDLFNFGSGKYLVCVGQWSGFPLFHKLHPTTSSSVIKILSEWFNLLGWPRSIRSDGVPQFRSEFVDFCAKYQIKHEMSSPYNPWANGLAGSAVKIVKNMLKKCLDEGEDVDRALYEWIILQRKHGFSPSQLLFGRRQRMLLPELNSAYKQVDFEKAAMAKNKHFDAQGVRYDRDKVSLPVLSVGQLVRIQDDKLASGRL